MIDGTQGITLYNEGVVYIQRGVQSRMLVALKHELTHVWLWEYGHNQTDENKTFNNEDVCEIVACSNNWINEVVKKYEKAKIEKKD